jgi:hypothetical protein
MKNKATQMNNQQKAQQFVAGTFDLLAKTGESLNYQFTAQVAEGLLGHYFDVLSEDDRFKMAAIATALYLSRDVDTGLLETMTEAESKAASEAIGKGTKHGK